MITVDGLTKVYGNTVAIQDVSFSVDTGEILGFLGPNGAGKTTTMRILTCHTPPTRGTASVAGYNIHTHSLDVRRNIGYMPETVPLYTEMTVASYLDFMVHAKGYNRKERPSYVARAIEETGLESVSSRLIGNLSKGYRQRVGLAQALIGNPKVLVLDEPTIGLDPKQISEIRTLIKSLTKKRTVILSTHILPEVSMTCSKVVIINEGRIVAFGTPEKLVTELQQITQTYATIEGPAEKVITRLRSITDVETVQLARKISPNQHEYLIESKKETDIRAQISQTIVAAGWKLLELRTVGLSLEDIFMQVVAGETEGPRNVV
jgi:ABC-2 type transport system ATP-binding protein